MRSVPYASAASPVSYTVARNAQAPVRRLFDEVVAEDVLPKVLHRYGIIPAVVGTEGLTGPWNTPGSQRQVRTSDGRTVREQVTAWEQSRYFAYQVDNFTGFMNRLVTHAAGEWHFSGADSGSRFVWTYRFFPAHTATAPFVWLFVTAMWSGYMRQCADRLVALAETPAAPS